MPNPKDLVTYEALEAFKNKIVNLILVYKSGYYDKNSTYDVGDVVFYQRGIYICIEDSFGNNPPTDENYWEPIDIAVE